MSIDTFLIIESIIEKFKQLESIEQELPFNPEISHDLIMRLKTCIAQIKLLRGVKASLDKYNSLLSLNFHLDRGIEILYEVAGEEVILNLWNGNKEIVRIEETFHNIGFDFGRLEIENCIMINNDMNKIQLLLNTIFENLQKLIKSWQSLSSMQDPENIEKLSKILSCKQSKILKIYEKYLNYFRTTDQEYNLISNLSLSLSQSATFIFSNRAAQSFWHQNFSQNSHAYWNQFQSALGHQLDFFRYPNEIRQQLIQFIRKKVDSQGSGLISQKSCNSFFNHYFLSIDSIIPQLEPFNASQSPSLSLKILSSPNPKLKIGSKLKLNPNSCQDQVLVIGRDPHKVNFSIQDPSLSAVHGMIAYTPYQGLAYTDLGSSGGSFTQITQPIALKPGQVIQLASTQMIHFIKVANQDTRKTKILQDDSDNLTFEGLSKLQEASSNQIENKSFKNNTIVELSSEKEDSLFMLPDKTSGFLKIDMDKQDDDRENGISLNLKHSEIVKAEKFDDKSFDGGINLVETHFIEFEFVVKGVNKGRVFKFTANTEVISIGRGHDCMVCVNDEFVSTLHGTINYTENGWEYSDSLSSNKSWICINQYDDYIKRNPSPKVSLCSGDLIKLGNIDFLIEINN